MDYEKGEKNNDLTFLSLLNHKQSGFLCIFTLSVRNKTKAIASYFKLKILAVFIPDIDSFIFTLAVGKIA